MATVPAILGTARLGNFRLGYESASLADIRETMVRVTIAGLDAMGLATTRRIRYGSITVRDVLNDAPNTASFIVRGTAPLDGQDVRISVNADTPRLLFNGTIQMDDLTYVGRPNELEWPVSAVDDLFRLNEKRPFGTWVDVSVSTIAAEMMADFAPGFTAAHVEAGLPTVSIIFDGTDDFSACLGRLATAIGGYFYVEDLDLHLFQTEATDSPLNIDDTPNRFAEDPQIVARVDRSQLRTTQYGKGHGEEVLVDLAAGENIIPIADAVMFNPAGGLAIAGTTPDGAQSQRLAYTGVILAGPGTIIGPGAGPSVAPSLAPADGSGLTDGTYKYAYTDVTGAGESLPSPLGTVTLGGTLTDPSAAPTASISNTPAPLPLFAGNTYKWAYTFYTAAGETLPSALHTRLIPAGGPYTASLTLALGPAGTTGRKVYRTVANGVQLKLVGTVANNATLFYDDHTLDAGLGANAPTSNTATTGHQVAISGVAIGPSGTTQRKIYRTVVGGSQLKLQQTIANNTATVGVQDATADGSLGANAPVVDTSGLTQPFGQVNAGSTSILTSGTGTLAPSGYLLAPTGDIIRYTGTASNTLTGIPESGPGSIVTSLFYEDQLVPVPALTGVTGLDLPMLRGTPVHIWVRRDDFAAQADQIALDAAQGRTSDGVIEGPVIVDERRGEDSLTALCDATLALFSRPIVTVTYATRDPKTKSGKQVTVNLTTPPISVTLTIQDVTITEIGTARAGSGIGPKFQVVASTWHGTLEAMLRKLAN